MSLSDRVRGGSEAAPWVVDEIAKLEADLAEARGLLENGAPRRRVLAAGKWDEWLDRRDAFLSRTEGK